MKTSLFVGFARLLLFFAMCVIAEPLLMRSNSSGKARINLLWLTDDQVSAHLPAVQLALDYINADQSVLGQYELAVLKHVTSVRHIASGCEIFQLLVLL